MPADQEGGEESLRGGAEEVTRRLPAQGHPRRTTGRGGEPGETRAVQAVGPEDRGEQGTGHLPTTAGGGASSKGQGTGALSNGGATGDATTGPAESETPGLPQLHGLLLLLPYSGTHWQVEGEQGGLDGGIPQQLCPQGRDQSGHPAEPHSAELPVFQPDRVGPALHQQDQLPGLPVEHPVPEIPLLHRPDQGHPAGLPRQFPETHPGHPQGPRERLPRLQDESLETGHHCRDAHGRRP